MRNTLNIATTKIAAIAALAWMLTIPALAPASAQDADENSSPTIEEPVRFESRGTVRIGGQNVRYTAVAGETFLHDEHDEPVASIFSITYTRDGDFDPRNRPVLFVFNGGPGSASLWLHMGVFGPRRVAVPSDARDDGAPPYEMVENTLSILDIADLVFIDPVGTGYSRVLGDEDPQDYYGVQRDAASISRFIRIWLTENQRWNSPKYLAGESYGTTRAVALVNELTGGWNDVALNGVVLISAILDFQTARFAPGNDSAHIAFLPSMAMTACFHERALPCVGKTPEAYAEEVREFAVTDYASALLRGARLSSDDRDSVIARLSAYTGLSEGYIDRANLRINAARFMKELLREDGLVVGRLDSRYTGRDADGVGARPEADPAGYGVDGAYTAVMNDYLTRELGVDIRRDYQVLSYQVNRQWSWDMEDGANWPSYVNVTPWLGAGMRQNSDMRVLLASGWYDLATPFFGAELAIQRNGVPYERVTRTYYEAGHMMYVHEPSLNKLAADVRAFISEE